MSKSSKPSKASKPHPDFRLFPRATGRWARRYGASFHYLGKVADDSKGYAALAKWLARKTNSWPGTPRVKAEGRVVQELVNRFRSAKRHFVDAHEITRAHLYGPVRHVPTGGRKLRLGPVGSGPVPRRLRPAPPADRQVMETDSAGQRNPAGSLPVQVRLRGRLDPQRVAADRSLTRQGCVYGILVRGIAADADA